MTREASGARDRPAAAWLTALPDEARRYQGQPAGLVSRTIAAVVDCVVLVLVLSAVYVAWAVVKYSLDPVRFSFPTPVRGILVAVAIGVAMGYLALCWGATGRTFGDQLLCLRVVDGRGPALRPGRALVRAVTCVFVPVGLFWVLVGTGRRSAQDVVLRTSVVYDWDPHLRPGPDLTRTERRRVRSGHDTVARPRRRGGDRS